MGRMRLLECWRISWLVDEESHQWDEFFWVVIMTTKVIVGCYLYKALYHNCIASCKKKKKKNFYFFSFSFGFLSLSLPHGIKRDIRPDLLVSFDCVMGTRLIGPWLLVTGYHRLLPSSFVWKESDLRLAFDDAKKSHHLFLFFNETNGWIIPIRFNGAIVSLYSIPCIRIVGWGRIADIFQNRTANSEMENGHWQKSRWMRMAQISKVVCRCFSAYICAHNDIQIL